jgi:hypothetical protein
VFAHVDANFACHENMKGHTGTSITVGNGQVTASPRKQGLVTVSFTETELVGISDASANIMDSWHSSRWTYEAAAWGSLSDCVEKNCLEGCLLAGLKSALEIR